MIFTESVITTDTLDTVQSQPLNLVTSGKWTDNMYLNLLLWSWIPDSKNNIVIITTCVTDQNQQTLALTKKSDIKSATAYNFKK